MTAEVEKEETVCEVFLFFLLKKSVVSSSLSCLKEQGIQAGGQALGQNWRTTFGEALRPWWGTLVPSSGKRSLNHHPSSPSREERYKSHACWSAIDCGSFFFFLGLVPVQGSQTSQCFLPNPPTPFPVNLLAYSFTGVCVSSK